MNPFSLDHIFPSLPSRLSPQADCSPRARAAVSPVPVDRPALLLLFCHRFSRWLLFLPSSCQRTPTRHFACYMPPKLARYATYLVAYSNQIGCGDAPLVGLVRVELTTSRLSGVRSNHLSYRPRRCEHRSAALPRPLAQRALCRQLGVATVIRHGIYRKGRRV